MALNSLNLARIAHANGKNVFIYHSADTIATVVAANYFNGASDQFFKGDIIIAVDTNANTIDALVVSSADRAAVVTVVNGT
jgi:hypothetical protein